MFCLKALSGALQGAPRSQLAISQPAAGSTARTIYRKPSPCDVCLYPPDRRPCFDMKNVSIERGTSCHAKLIRSFLYTHHWPREPSVTGLWLPLDSPYLACLTEKYANSGDRLLAFERQKRTGERKLIGVSVGNKTFPWVADELEEWAHFTYSLPERHRMYFCAHCLRSPNCFKNYHVDYIYEIEVLCTAAEVTGRGVATALLRTALAHGKELRHPLIQMMAYSAYAAKVCERCGMQREWTMNYSDYVDDFGQRVFFPRRPHRAAALYVKQFDPKEQTAPCKPPFFK